MIGALVALASALLVAPRSRALRRRAVFFGRTRDAHGRPRKYLAVVAVAGGAVVALAFGVGPVVAAGLMGTTAVIRRRRVHRDRRRARESAHLSDALEAVIAELRIGAHPGAAAEIAAREAAGIAARSFAVAAARSRLGGCGAAGLRHPDAVVAVELDRIADAWQVAEDHGLALAELLSAARADLLGRIRFRARTNAALAGARATAAVLAGLPLLGIGLGQLMGAAPIEVLLGAGLGTVLLPLGAGLVCAGLLWTDAITERVLV